MSSGSFLLGNTQTVQAHTSLDKAKPLDGSAVVLDTDHAKQIQILLNGAANGAMPAWKQLSDTDIAAVTTYTKNTWSNKTGQLVQPAEVVAQRGK